MEIKVRNNIVKFNDNIDDVDYSNEPMYTYDESYNKAIFDLFSFTYGVDFEDRWGLDTAEKYKTFFRTLFSLLQSSTRACNNFKKYGRRCTFTIAKDGTVSKINAPKY